ncbi:heme exporter protein D [Modestobacter marinus]|nr:heme exporter protein D [Modestobacter marinus]
MDDWLSLVLIIAALVVLALVTFSVAQRRHIAKKRRR